MFLPVLLIWAPDLSSAVIPLRCMCSDRPEILRMGFNALKQVMPWRGWAQVAERLMAADCKSAAPCELRRFESSPVHHDLRGWF